MRYGFLIALLMLGCSSASSSSPAPGSLQDAGASVDAPADSASADWVIVVGPRDTPSGTVSTSLLGQYDLSGALFRYDEVPGLVQAMSQVGFSDWRVGLGRWEITTQLLPFLTDGTDCRPILGSLPPEASSTASDELALIASRDWFIDDGAPVSLAATQDDRRYNLSYVRKVLDVANAFSASPLVNIDHMPRAFSSHKTPSRTLAAQPKACTMSWTNQVSNVAPDTAYLAAENGAAPIFASAVVGLVKRIVEGSGGAPGRAVKYWEFWNEPELPYAWDPAFDDTNRTKFFTTAAQTLMMLDAYRNQPQSPKDLRFGLGSFATADVAASTIALYDTLQTKVPIDFISFHSYSNDPQVIVADLKKVADAKARSSRYKDVELALTEWGPDLASPPDPSTMDSALLVTAVLAQAPEIGIQRAYHSVFYDFYEAIPFGLLTHEVRPKPLYHAYELLARVIGSGGSRLSVLSAPDGQLEGGQGAVLVTKDKAGKVRLLLVNRGQEERSVKVELEGAESGPSQVLVLSDPGQGIAAQGAQGQVKMPPRSIVLLEY